MNYKYRKYIPFKIYLDCKSTILPQVWNNFNLDWFGFFPSLLLTKSIVNINKEESTFTGTYLKISDILGKDSNYLGVGPFRKLLLK